MSIKPAVILVAPQMGENIGAAARAMLNFGLDDLRLVNPRDGWPDISAERNAVGALDKGVSVQVFDTLEEAIADLQYTLVTTARKRDMAKPVYTPQSAHEQLAPHEKTGIIFGGERAGLTNDDIALSQGIITIPTNPDFSSLNLGQSVLLVAYELFRTDDNTPPEQMIMGDSAPTSQEEVSEFLTRLETELEGGDFFRADELRPTLMRNIKNIFTRQQLSEQEVRTLHGIVSALLGKKKKPPK